MKNLKGHILTEARRDLDEFVNSIFNIKIKLQNGSYATPFDIKGMFLPSEVIKKEADNRSNVVGYIKKLKEIERIYVQGRLEENSVGWGKSKSDTLKYIASTLRYAEALDLKFLIESELKTPEDVSRQHTAEVGKKLFGSDFSKIKNLKSIAANIEAYPQSPEYYLAEGWEFEKKCSCDDCTCDNPYAEEIEQTEKEKQAQATIYQKTSCFTNKSKCKRKNAFENIKTNKFSGQCCEQMQNAEKCYIIALVKNPDLSSLTAAKAIQRLIKIYKHFCTTCKNEKAEEGSHLSTSGQAVCKDCSTGRYTPEEIKNYESAIKGNKGDSQFLAARYNTVNSLKRLAIVATPAVNGQKQSIKNVCEVYFNSRPAPFNEQVELKKILSNKIDFRKLSDMSATATLLGEELKSLEEKKLLELDIQIKKDNRLKLKKQEEWKNDFKKKFGKEPNEEDIENAIKNKEYERTTTIDSDAMLAAAYPTKGEMAQISKKVESKIQSENKTSFFNEQGGGNFPNLINFWVSGGFLLIGKDTIANHTSMSKISSSVKSRMYDVLHTITSYADLLGYERIPFLKHEWNARYAKCEKCGCFAEVKEVNKKYVAKCYRCNEEEIKKRYEKWVESFEEQNNRTPQKSERKSAISSIQKEMEETGLWSPDPSDVKLKPMIDFLIDFEMQYYLSNILHRQTAKIQSKHELIINVSNPENKGQPEENDLCWYNTKDGYVEDEMTALGHCGNNFYGKKCRTCDGKGEIGVEDDSRTCPKCKGNKIASNEGVLGWMKEKGLDPKNNPMEELLSLRIVKKLKDVGSTTGVAQPIFTAILHHHIPGSPERDNPWLGEMKAANNQRPNQRSSNIQINMIKTCNVCQGSKQIETDGQKTNCNKCNGTGKIKTLEKISEKDAIHMAMTALFTSKNEQGKPYVMGAKGSEKDCRGKMRAMGRNNFCLYERNPYASGEIKPDSGTEMKQDDMAKSGIDWSDLSIDELKKIHEENPQAFYEKDPSSYKPSVEGASDQEVKTYKESRLMCKYCENIYSIKKEKTINAGNNWYEAIIKAFDNQVKMGKTIDKDPAARGKEVEGGKINIVAPGKRNIWVTYKDPYDVYGQDCDKCKGEGVVTMGTGDESASFHCDKCKGTGRLIKDEFLKLVNSHDLVEVPVKQGEQVPEYKKESKERIQKIAQSFKEAKVMCTKEFKKIYSGICLMYPEYIKERFGDISRNEAKKKLEEQFENILKEYTKRKIDFNAMKADFEKRELEKKQKELKKEMPPLPDIPKEPNPEEKD